MKKRDKLWEYFREMLKIRYFENKIEELFRDGALYGTTHLCIGQEACAVGVCGALMEMDYVTSTHRGHGHYLARGGSVESVLAEVMGLPSGICHGRGGSQQLFDRKIGFMGANGITGGGLPIAVGLAFGAKSLKQNRVVAAFFGEGAANEGAFHEAMNIASCFQLPVLFVCENNLYCMSTPFSAVSGSKNVADRACAYNIPSTSVDGNDVMKVEAAARAAVRKVRTRCAPFLLELNTYRQVGHSKSDKCVYRSRLEEQEWLDKCPIKMARTRLIEMGFERKELDGIEKQIQKEIDEVCRKLQKRKVG